MHRRACSGPGIGSSGPALIIEQNQTIVVEARLGGRDHGEEPRAAPPRSSPSDAPPALGTKVDPVTLEIFNNLFMSIAEQMGVTLQHTAVR